MAVFFFFILWVTIMENNRKQKGSELKIGTIVHVRLLALLVVSFVLAAIVGIVIQNAVQRRQSFTLIQEYIDDFFYIWNFDESIREEETQWMQHTVEPAGKEYYMDDAILQRFVGANGNTASELNYVDVNGIVTHSSNPDMIGYDLRSNDYTAPFLCLLDDEDYFAESLYPNPFQNDPSMKMVYIGLAFPDHQSMLLKGMTEEVWDRRLRANIADYIEPSRIGVSGYLLVLDEDLLICAASYVSGIEEGTPFERVDVLPQKNGVIKETITDFDGQKCYISAIKNNDFYLIGVYPKDEADTLRDKGNNLFVIEFVIIFLVLFVVISILVRNHILKQVEGIHTSLNRIIKGNLSEKVNVGGSVEFVGLSSGINEMVENLSDRLEQEKKQLAEKLENARRIQKSAVPQIFPEHSSFALFACMEPAEMVSGDFYDFYLPTHDILAFVMADVSGIGMPAALYMMRAKTLIKTYAEQGIPVDQVAEKTNRKLCEDAVEEMSVTAWIGFLNLKSGEISFVNAGHPNPVLTGEEVSFVKEETDMALGVSKDAHYVKQEITLGNGNGIFLYSSGAIGARNQNGEPYGEERLCHVIREQAKQAHESNGNDRCEAGCMAVMEDVKHHAAGAKRQDDITMMWIQYWGNSNQRT